MAVIALTMKQLQDLPVVVDLTTAAKCWGFSRTHAYDLVKRGEFPVRVMRVGNAWRVTRHDLLTGLGFDPVSVLPLAQPEQVAVPGDLAAEERSRRTSPADSRVGHRSSR